ncbi:tudor domain-containing protein 5 isoform X2 [Pseudophryne corroboree]|uniref:tudor domain-containing protein 5 isoform X2 n=1 Tax=Pseudophryne corroboree TaxID=495146 RepID=UPI0030821DB7
MDKDRVLQRLQKDVRSLLIASKHGLSIQELEHDYRMLIGTALPVRKLDYRTTMELLLDMPDVVNIHTKVDGTVVLSAVVNEETKSIADLVSRQKAQTKRKVLNKRRVVRPVCHKDLVRRGRIAPVLPASMKSDLRELLSISPLLVSHLETAFYKRFGRSFQYTRYGFYSLIEVLRSVSDIIQVTQTRAGSLLVLRNADPKGTSVGSSIQLSNQAVTFKGTCSVSVDAQNSKRKPFVQDIPLPDASTPSAGTTTLEKLLNDAETNYFASKISLKTLPIDPKFGVCDSQVMTENSVLGVNLPLSLFPSPVPRDTANKLLVKPPIHIETITAGGTSLAAGTMELGTAEPDNNCSLQWLEEKLDKDLKLCLSQKRTAGVFSPDLRRDIKHVVNQYSQGLPVSQLSGLYKQYTGKDLPFREMGFLSVLDLVGSLGDMLYLECTVDGQDWRIFDMEKKQKKDVTDSKVLSLVEPTSRWNSPIQKSECLKPQMIKISTTDASSSWRPLDVQLPVSQQEIPPDAVRKQKLRCLSHMKRGFVIGVFVENIISPSEFYIRCYSKDTSQKLEDMMIEMRCCYSSEHVSSRYVVPDDYISVGDIFAVCVPGDVWWYRVIVHLVISSTEIQVYYPDFGNVATVKRCWLRFLKACYMNLPAQAVPSSLAFVKPVEDQWSTEAIKSFQQHCTKGPLVGVVLQYVLDQLYLFLCDTSTEEDLYLHQQLINHRLGSTGQEPGFYKDLHKCNPFVHYLFKSIEKPQEDLQDDSMQTEKQTVKPTVEPINDQEALLQDISFQTVKEEAESEMPYLEAIPTGEDVWDENWSFSSNTMTLDVLKPHSVNLDKNQEEEKPKEEQVNDFVKANDLNLLSIPLEEFYISLIESRNTLEKCAVPNSPVIECGPAQKTNPPVPEPLYGAWRPGMKLT